MQHVGKPWKPHSTTLDEWRREDGKTHDDLPDIATGLFQSSKVASPTHHDEPTDMVEELKLSSSVMLQ